MPLDPALEKLVDAGRLGRKAKKGFYLYEGDKRGGPDPRSTPSSASRHLPRIRLSPPRSRSRLILPMVNEAAFCLAEGIVASPAKLDLAMIFGTGFPPFRGGLLRPRGRARARRRSSTASRSSRGEKGPRFTPAPLLVDMAKAGKKILRYPRAGIAPSRKNSLREIPMSTVKAEEPKPETTEVESFLKTLFQGHIAEDLVFPFPEIPAGREGDRGGVRGRLPEFDAAHLDSEKIDAEHFFPREVVKAMGELGVLGMTIPEEYGGSGFSSAAYCRMTETIAPLDASASIVVGAHQSIGIKPLLLFGNDEQKKKWLPGLATGKLVAAFCLTEPEAGSDAGSLKTTAVYDPATDEYVLNGTKQWISQRRLRPLLLGLRAHPLGHPREGQAQGDRLLRGRHERGRHAARPLARRRGEEARPLRVVDLPDHLRELPRPGREPHRREGPRLQGRRSRR